MIYVNIVGNVFRIYFFFCLENYYHYLFVFYSRTRSMQGEERNMSFELCGIYIIEVT